MKRVLLVLAVLAALPLAYALPAEKLAEVTSSGTSVRSVYLQSGKSIIYSCDGDAYLRFGDSTVVATADSKLYKSTSVPAIWGGCVSGGYNYLAVLSVGAGLVKCVVHNDAGGGPCP